MTVLPEVKNDYGRLKLYIDGKWVDSESDNLRDVFNPAKDVSIAKVPLALPEEANKAVEAAERAFQKWRDTPLRDRIHFVKKLAYKFEEHLEELARVQTQNQGSTIDESRDTMKRCIENMDSACATALMTAKGEYVDQIAPGIDQTLIVEPLGVFAIITPTNIPVHAWSSFVPYALALGCTVVVSPATACSAISNWVFKVTEEVGFPSGAVNLVYGGREINTALVSHRDIQGIGFIGSTGVGKQLFDLASKLGKRASINGGAKNHIVFMPDADVDILTPRLIRAFYGMAGQRCLRPNNLVVIGDVYEKVKERFVELSSKIKVGYGLDDEVQLGPLTTKEGKQKGLDCIEEGLSNGADLILDGRNRKVAEPYSKGYFLGPTVFDNVTRDMKIAKEELFSPIANLLRAENMDEAIDMINNNVDYGHSACIFTSNINTAREFRRRVNTGNVGINAAIPQPYATFPLGSRRQSAFGMSHSRADSWKLFTDAKVVVTWRY